MKKRYLILIFIVMIFSLKIDVKADSFTVSYSRDISLSRSKKGCHSNYPCYEIDGYYYDNYDSSTYPNFGYKRDKEGNDLICITALRADTPNTGTVCTQSTWSDMSGYGVGYILHELYPNGKASVMNYYLAELLVLYYVNNEYFGASRYDDPTWSSYRGGLRENIVGNSSFKIPGTEKSFKQIISEAKAYAKSMTNSTNSGSSKQNIQLTFTLNEDGYYYSNEISLSNDEGLNIDNPKFTYDKNDGKYIFKIKASDIEKGTDERINATIGSGYYYAYKYSCPGNNVQDVTRVKDIDKSVTITGIVEPKYCYFKYNATSGTNSYNTLTASEATVDWKLCNDGSDICNKCEEPEKCYLNNEGKYVWGRFNNRIGYVVQEDMSREECNSVVICNPSPIAKPGSNVDANKCEDNLTKTYESGVSCDGTYGTGFYTINCKTYIKPSFDLGNDAISNDKLILYRGQGMGFGIRLEIIKRCEGKIKKELWESVYNQYNKEGSTPEETNGNQNVVSKLKEIVTSAFNDWEYKEPPIPNIELTLLTEPSVNINRMNLKILKEGTAKRTEKEVNLASGTVVAKNFVYTNEEDSKVVIYYPPKVYLDRLTGEITNSNANTIDGGNKVYVGLDAEIGTNYPVNIRITNLEDGKEITNNKCHVDVIEPKSLYRIIDINNPFVNNKRKRPENWINDSMDYSTIIDGSTTKGRERINTYKNNPLYTFVLSGAEVNDIKASNKKIGVDYLGTCQNDKKDSTVANKICNIINKK